MTVDVYRKKIIINISDYIWGNSLGESTSNNTVPFTSAKK
jgi:hypothetical protein